MNVYRLFILIFCLMALLEALYLIRSVKRPARARLSLEISAVSFAALLLVVFFTTGLIAAFVEEGTRRIFLLPLLLALETAVAAFSLIWLFFRNRWRSSNVPPMVYKFTVMVSGAIAFAIVIAAVAMVQGALSMNETALFGYLVAGIFYFGPQVLLSIEWRLSITPTPKKLRGEPLLLISAGLLTMGLLGLSGLF